MHSLEDHELKEQASYDTSQWTLDEPGGWGYSQKNLVGVCGPIAKTLTLFMPKIGDFAPTLFMTKPKFWYPIYDRRGWHSCPTHNFLRVFANVFIDND